MEIHILAVGSRMPEWVERGYREYAKRMPKHCRLDLREIPAGRRTKGADIARALQEEGARLLAAVPPGTHVVALERRGRPIDTASLAAELRRWLDSGTEPVFLIGGPEGLHSDCLARANATWSLSALTMAHPVVRVVLAEQLYRAWSIVAGLPYHR